MMGGLTEDSIKWGILNHCKEITIDLHNNTAGVFFSTVAHKVLVKNKIDKLSELSKLAKIRQI